MNAQAGDRTPAAPRRRPAIHRVEPRYTYLRIAVTVAFLRLTGAAWGGRANGHRPAEDPHFSEKERPPEGGGRSGSSLCTPAANAEP
jgi:hypothetical protein